jgi:replication-associated recombination protein RarA
MATAQTSIDLGEARQHDLVFPVTLAEKYQPGIADFVGLAEPKRIMLGLLAKPKPINLLFIGDPGSGKTTMAMKFAEALPASHHHIRAQSADVATLDEIWERCQYYPARGRFHVVHIDEVDGATDKAQLQLLSRMDGTACLKPMYGGGFERGEVPPIIYIFTCNGRFVNGKMEPPPELLPRFLSRCLPLRFEQVERKQLAAYLKDIWAREGGPKHYPVEYFEHLADGGIGVREALNRLDSELLAPRPSADVARVLADARAAAIARERSAALIAQLNYANKCGHDKAEPSGSRGLCVDCYKDYCREQRRRLKTRCSA